MSAYDVALIGTICYRFRILMPLLQSHLDDYDGLLPHVFMGDLTRWAVQRFLADTSDPTLRELLDFLEHSFETATEEEQELIAVSFLENLPREGQEGDGIRRLLGPELQDQLGQIS